MDYQRALQDGLSPETIMQEMERRGAKLDYKRALSDGVSSDDIMREMVTRIPSQEQPIPAVDPNNPSGFIRRAADIPVGIAKGVAKLPQIITGLADIPTGGRVGKFVEDTTGYSGKAIDKAFDPYLSPETRLAQQKVAETKGFLPTVQSYIENPSAIMQGISESVPSMIGGGILGRAVMKGAGLMSGIVEREAAVNAARLAGRAAPELTKDAAIQIGKEAVRAGGVGEGLVMAGQGLETMREESKTGLTTPMQSLAAIGIGIGGGFIGMKSAGFAKRLGMGDMLDIDAAIAGGAVGRSATEVVRDSVNASAKRMTTIQGIKEIGKGFIQEGILEEMPQSGLETILSNVSSGKQWDEGLGNALGAGLIVGGAMGSGFNARHLKSGITNDISQALLNRKIDLATEQTQGQPLEGANADQPIVSPTPDVLTRSASMVTPELTAELQAKAQEPKRSDEMKPHLTETGFVPQEFRDSVEQDLTHTDPLKREAAIKDRESILANDKREENAFKKSEMKVAESANEITTAETVFKSKETSIKEKINSLNQELKEINSAPKVEAGKEGKVDARKRIAAAIKSSEGDLAIAQQKLDSVITNHQTTLDNHSQLQERLSTLQEIPNANQNVEVQGIPNVANQETPIKAKTDNGQTFDMLGFQQTYESLAPHIKEFSTKAMTVARDAAHYVKMMVSKFGKAIAETARQIWEYTKQTLSSKRGSFSWENGNQKYKGDAQYTNQDIIQGRVDRAVSLVAESGDKATTDLFHNEVRHNLKEFGKEATIQTLLWRLERTKSPTIVNSDTSQEWVDYNNQSKTRVIGAITDSLKRLGYDSSKSGGVKAATPTAVAQTIDTPTAPKTIDTSSAPRFAQDKEQAKAEGANWVLAPKGISGSYASRIAEQAESKGMLVTNPEQVKAGDVIYLSTPGKGRGYSFASGEYKILPALLDKGAIIRTDTEANAKSAHNIEGEGKVYASLKAKGYVATNKGLYTEWTAQPVATKERSQIFVFGSNPEGRHGAGAAKVAVEQHGAKYGQGEGLQGNAYALPTKDLRVKENNGYQSIKPPAIIESIKKLYKTAQEHPDKDFNISYNNTDKKSLNGYTGFEMIDMFNSAGDAPKNINFSKEWIATGKLGSQLTQTTKTEETVLSNTEQDMYLFITDAFKKYHSDYAINGSIAVIENGIVGYRDKKHVFDFDIVIFEKSKLLDDFHSENPVEKIFGETDRVKQIFDRMFLVTDKNHSLSFEEYDDGYTGGVKVNIIDNSGKIVLSFENEDVNEVETFSKNSPFRVLDIRFDSKENVNPITNSNGVPIASIEYIKKTKQIMIDGYTPEPGKVKARKDLAFFQSHNEKLSETLIPAPAIKTEEVSVKPIKSEKIDTAKDLYRQANQQSDSAFTGRTEQSIQEAEKFDTNNPESFAAKQAISDISDYFSAYEEERDQTSKKTGVKKQSKNYNPEEDIHNKIDSGVVLTTWEIDNLIGKMTKESLLTKGEAKFLRDDIAAMKDGPTTKDFMNMVRNVLSLEQEELHSSNDITNDETKRMDYLDEILADEDFWESTKNQTREVLDTMEDEDESKIDNLQRPEYPTIQQSTSYYMRRVLSGIDPNDTGKLRNGESLPKWTKPLIAEMEKQYPELVHGSDELVKKASTTKAWITEAVARDGKTLEKNKVLLRGIEDKLRNNKALAAYNETHTDYSPQIGENVYDNEVDAFLGMLYELQDMEYDILPISRKLLDGYKDFNSIESLPMAEAEALFDKLSSHNYKQFSRTEVDLTQEELDSQKKRNATAQTANNRIGKAKNESETNTIKPSVKQRYDSFIKTISLNKEAYEVVDAYMELIDRFMDQKPYDSAHLVDMDEMLKLITGSIKNSDGKWIPRFPEIAKKYGFIGRNGSYAYSVQSKNKLLSILNELKKYSYLNEHHRTDMEIEDFVDETQSERVEAYQDINRMYPGEPNYPDSAANINPDQPIASAIVPVGGLQHLWDVSFEKDGKKITKTVDKKGLKLYQQMIDSGKATSEEHFATENRSSVPVYQYESNEDNPWGEKNIRWFTAAQIATGATNPRGMSPGYSPVLDKNEYVITRNTATNAGTKDKVITLWGNDNLQNMVDMYRRFINGNIFSPANRLIAKMRKLSREAKLATDENDKFEKYEQMKLVKKQLVDEVRPARNEAMRLMLRNSVVMNENFFVDTSNKLNEQLGLAGTESIGDGSLFELYEKVGYDIGAFQSQLKNIATEAIDNKVRNAYLQLREGRIQDVLTSDLSDADKKLYQQYVNGMLQQKQTDKNNPIIADFPSWWVKEWKQNEPHRNKAAQNIVRIKLETIFGIQIRAEQVWESHIEGHSKPNNKPLSTQAKLQAVSDEIVRLNEELKAQPETIIDGRPKKQPRLAKDFNRNESGVEAGSPVIAKPYNRQANIDKQKELYAQIPLLEQQIQKEAAEQKQETINKLHIEAWRAGREYISNEVAEQYVADLFSDEHIVTTTAQDVSEYGKDLTHVESMKSPIAQMFFEGIANLFGADLVLVKGDGFKGRYIAKAKDGRSKIVINPFMKTGLARVFAHELFHHVLNKVSPSAYTAFRTALMDSVDRELWDKTVKEHLERNGYLSPESKYQMMEEFKFNEMPAKAKTSYRDASVADDRQEDITKNKVVSFGRHKIVVPMNKEFFDFMKSLGTTAPEFRVNIEKEIESKRETYKTSTIPEKQKLIRAFVKNIQDNVIGANRKSLFDVSFKGKEITPEILDSLRRAADGYVSKPNNNSDAEFTDQEWEKHKQEIADYEQAKERIEEEIYAEIFAQAFHQKTFWDALAKTLEGRGVATQLLVRMAEQSTKILKFMNSMNTPMMGHDPLNNKFVADMVKDWSGRKIIRVPVDSSVVDTEKSGKQWNGTSYVTSKATSVVYLPKRDSSGEIVYENRVIFEGGVNQLLADMVSEALDSKGLRHTDTRNMTEFVKQYAGQAKESVVSSYTKAAKSTKGYEGVKTALNTWSNIVLDFINSVKPDSWFADYRIENKTVMRLMQALNHAGNKASNEAEIKIINKHKEVIETIRKMTDVQMEDLHDKIVREHNKTKRDANFAALPQNMQDMFNDMKEITDAIHGRFVELGIMTKEQYRVSHYGQTIKWFRQGVPLDDSMLAVVMAEKSILQKSENFLDSKSSATTPEIKARGLTYKTIDPISMFKQYVEDATALITLQDTLQQLEKEGLMVRDTSAIKAGKEGFVGVTDLAFQVRRQFEKGFRIKLGEEYSIDENGNDNVYRTAEAANEALKALSPEMQAEALVEEINKPQNMKDITHYNLFVERSEVVDKMKYVYDKKLRKKVATPYQETVWKRDKQRTATRETKAGADKAIAEHNEAGTRLVAVPNWQDVTPTTESTLYFDKEAAKLMRVILSKDAIRGGKWGNRLLDLKNFLTMLELSLSGFHWMTIFQEAISSNVGVIGQRWARGEGSILDIFRAFNIKEGMRHRREYKMFLNKVITDKTFADSPAAQKELERLIGTTSLKAAEIWHHMAEQGGKFEQDSSLRGSIHEWGVVNQTNKEHAFNYSKAWDSVVETHEKIHGNTDNKLKAYAKEALFHALVTPSAYLMEEVIPAFKNLAFAKEFAANISYEERKQGRPLTYGEKQDIARNTMKMIEDKFGEVNWKNMWLNKTNKSLLQFSFRSFTWVAGSWKAMAKAGGELGKWGFLTVENVIKWGWLKGIKGGEYSFMGNQYAMTNKGYWGLAAVATSVATAQIINGLVYGIFKATGGDDDEWQDDDESVSLIVKMLFPRIDPHDNTKRMSFGSYPNEVFKHLSHLGVIGDDRQLMKIVSGRLNSIISMGVEFGWNNETFEGVTIRDSDDPWIHQGYDVSKYIVKKMAPMSVGGTIKALSENKPVSESVFRMGGFATAPASSMRSPAANLAFQLSRQEYKGKKITDEAFGLKQDQKAAFAKWSKGDKSDVDKMMDEGTMSKRQYDILKKRYPVLDGSPNPLYQDQLTQALSRITVRSALKVYNAMTEVEKEKHKPEIQKKINNMKVRKDQPPQLQEMYINKWNQLKESS